MVVRFQRDFIGHRFNDHAVRLLQITSSKLGSFRNLANDGGLKHGSENAAQQRPDQQRRQCVDAA